MIQERGAALQLCPFSDYLESNLAERFEVVRWFELDEAARAAWVADHAASAVAVITGGHLGCGNALMDALPNLGLIAINGVGFDKVDLDHARGRGVRVTTTLNGPTDDVADLAVGLTIALLREIPAGDAHVKAGRWPSGERRLARKVTGSRFGILGLGAIGSAIAARLAAFGPVAYAGTGRKPVPYEFHDSLAGLAAASDVLIVACAANASTRHIVDASVLETLGPSSFLVNVSRGSVVDEAAPIAALQDGRIAGAALDVFEDEPNVPEALRDCPNVVLTPHIASATAETRKRMADMVLESLDALRAGTPLNLAIA